MAQPDANPPARPAMSDSTPAPTAPVDPPLPGALRAGRLVWLVSIAAGLIAAGFAVVAREENRSRVVTMLADLDPARPAGEVESLATTVLWATIGALVVVTAVEALLLHRLVRRRRGTRAVQAVVLAAHVPLALLAEGFLAEPGPAGTTTRVLVLGQLASAGLAFLVTLLARSRP
ncbi:hypothetical protein V5H98_14100 [Georgenia sp. M64]|uniref:hypothetical protein n=1 Tax=Georgenia sp. M64 TaxID=3120520 RepID=UPI0030E1F0C6